MTRERIPVSIITGFLGSGKTTLLNKILQHPELSKSLVIINEFGEIGIDHLLVSAPVENMRLLSNGCLCCEVRGDLVETLAEAAQQRRNGTVPPFDRVIVETTGLADPVPLVRTVVTDVDVAPSYWLDSIITVVDAVNTLGQLDQQPEAVKQVAISDLLLISKSDIASESTIGAVRKRIRTINGNAEIMLVTHGEIAPALLFGRGMIDSEATTDELDNWLGWAIKELCTLASHEHCDHAHDEQDHLHHGGHISTFSLTLDRPTSSEALTVWLTMLANFLSKNLLRIKGLINVEGRPVAIHAVQTVIHPPVTLAQWPSEDRRSRIVFIIKDMDRKELERTVDVLADLRTSTVVGQSTPQSAYAGFLEMARRFR